MKKVIGLLLVMLMLFCLMACGKNESDEDTDAKNPTEGSHDSTDDEKDDNNEGDDKNESGNNVDDSANDNPSQLVAHVFSFDNFEVNTKDGDIPNKSLFYEGLSIHSLIDDIKTYSSTVNVIYKRNEHKKISFDEAMDVQIEPGYEATLEFYSDETERFLIEKGTHELLVANYAEDSLSVKECIDNGWYVLACERTTSQDKGRLNELFWFAETKLNVDWDNDGTISGMDKDMSVFSGLVEELGSPTYIHPTSSLSTVGGFYGYVGWEFNDYVLIVDLDDWNTEETYRFSIEFIYLFSKEHWLKSVGYEDYENQMEEFLEFKNNNSK